MIWSCTVSPFKIVSYHQGPQFVALRVESRGTRHRVDIPAMVPACTLCGTGLRSEASGCHPRRGCSDFLPGLAFLMWQLIQTRWVAICRVR